jgi:PhnB protein
MTVAGEALASGATSIEIDGTRRNVAMSETPFAAPGHPVVSPYVMAQGADALIAFIERVFGAEVLMRLARADGSVMHASVKIGDSVVMLADATPDYPGFPVWLHIYVPDVDATYAKALAAGATSVQEVSEKGDGDRRCGVEGPGGVTWWISTHVGQ